MKIWRFQSERSTNRWCLLMMKLNGNASSAPACSRRENSQNSIDVQGMDSRDSWRVRQWLDETDEDLGPWSTKQKELLNLVKNWWSFDQKCDEDFWWIWEKMEGKSVMFLRIVFIITNSVMIKVKYSLLNPIPNPN
jgi:hypothetical protein